MRISGLEVLPKGLRDQIQLAHWPGLWRRQRKTLSFGRRNCVINDLAEGGECFDGCFAVADAPGWKQIGTITDAGLVIFTPANE